LGASPPNYGRLISGEIRLRELNDRPMNEEVRAIPRQRDLAKAAGVHPTTRSTISRLGAMPGTPATLAASRKALEKAGAEFTNGKRPGLRLNVR
jgi:hypothetical protein